MSTQASTHYLEMTNSSDLRPSPKPKEDTKIDVKQQNILNPELSRYLYATVGEDWYWIDRLNWTDNQWLKYLNQSSVEMWVLYVAETVAGYFELKGDPQADVEIAYFGLMPQFIGQGLGGYLLTVATERAWQIGASRVWVHTSSRDHLSALSNYQARGFRVFKQEAL